MKEHKGMHNRPPRLHTWEFKATDEARIYDIRYKFKVRAHNIKEAYEKAIERCKKEGGIVGMDDTNRAKFVFLDIDEMSLKHIKSKRDWDEWAD